MKKIGILYGLDHTFANDLINNINQRNLKALKAESVIFSAVRSDDKTNYDLIFDMVSEIVPFYSAILKSLELKGVKVVSSQFSKSRNDFFYCFSSVVKNRIHCPKTAIIPAKNWPGNVTPDCLVNIEYPLNWESVFDSIGFPMIMRPNSIGAVKYSYKVYNSNEFFDSYDLTGSEQMIVEEAIDYDAIFKAYVVGGKDIILMPYYPDKALQYRFPAETVKLDEALTDKIKNNSKKMAKELNMDFCSFDFGIKDDKVYIFGFSNQSSYTELKYLQDADYNNLLESVASYLLSLIIKPSSVIKRKSLIMRSE